MSSHRRPVTTGDNAMRVSAAKQPPPPTAALRLLNEIHSRDLPRIDLMNLISNMGNSSSAPKSANPGPRCYATYPGGNHASRLDRLPTIRRESVNDRGTLEEMRMHNKLFPDSERTVVEALREAELAVPFEHATESYHTSQHSALNAELRRAAEKKLEQWTERVNAFDELLQRHAAESSSVNSDEIAALKAYFKSYCCPDDLKVLPEQLIERMGLSMTMGEIAQIQEVSTVSLDVIRRAFDNLLNADYPLASLQEYSEALSVLDRILGKNAAANSNGRGGEGYGADVAREPNDGNRHGMNCTNRSLSGAAVRALTSAASQRHEDSAGRNGSGRTPLHQPTQQPISSAGAYSTGNRPYTPRTNDALTTMSQSVCGVAATQSVSLLPSNTSIVLHERMHYEPCIKLLKEMKKNESSLSSMEQRAEEAKRRKESAIDSQDPIEALRNLHAQVDFSNNMLLINKQRMHLVSMHRDEIYALRDNITQCIDDANRVNERLDTRVASLLPRIAQDAQVVADGIESSKAELRELTAAEEEAEQNMRSSMRDVEAAEHARWTQIAALMDQLRESARNKLTMAQQHMALREQRAKEWRAAEELLHSRERHADLLSQCEVVLMRWKEGQMIHEKYVQTFTPKLLKRIQALEDNDEDLHNREAQSYVRRYETFAYAAEEARAKRCVQIDRMRMLQRSLELDSERAAESLDPAPELYAQRRVEAAKEAEEVSAYVNFITEMEQARRDEVEPVLHRVMAYNQAMQEQAAYENKQATARLSERRKEKRRSSQEGGSHGRRYSATKQLTPPESDEDQGGQTPSSSASSNDNSASRAAQGGEERERQTPVLVATVAHPFVTARNIGLAHNTRYLDKHNRYNETELCAVEDKMVTIRHQRTNLDDLATRYQNADYIRQLLQNAGEPDAEVRRF